MWAFPCTYYLWVLSKFDLLVLADLLPLLPFALQASLEEGNGYVNRMRVVIASFPEVENVVSQHGRPDDGTDATGFLNAEFFAPLKPALQWPVGMDKERLTSEILEKLQAEFIGVEFNFSQYLQDNVSEAVSGVKGENSIKLFGNDLQALTKTANQIKEVLSKVHGITDLAVFTSLGQPTVQIDVDRAGPEGMA
jgi:cobalt-zinc-cadmium resistance protein CzcA